jgi:hypothetical protein
VDARIVRLVCTTTALESKNAKRVLQVNIKMYQKDQNAKVTYKILIVKFCHT